MTSLDSTRLYSIQTLLLLLAIALLTTPTYAEKNTEEGPKKSTAIELDRIAAVVNGNIITNNELEGQTRTVQQQLRQQKTLIPPLSVLKKQVLEQLIISKLQLQLAEETGIRVSDNQLNQTIGKIAAQNNLSLRRFRQVLEDDGFSFAKFREDVRNEITISRLRQRQIDSRINITQQEVDNFLAGLRTQGITDDEYLLGHILIAVPEAASPDDIKAARAKGEKILNELREGADFKQTAITYSDGQKALEGGDLGWRRVNQLPTLFSGFVTQMSDGDISELIRSPSGFHIVTLFNHRNHEKHVVEQTHARHILIKTNELVDDDAAHSNLLELRQRVLSGDDFAELAQAHSDDKVSAAEGGELGWINPGEMVPAFESEINRLQPGEVSEPFQSPFGWHIAQVLERRNHEDTEEFKRVKAREVLHQQKAEEEYQAWLRRLRDEAYIEIR
ncbi:MAG: molecular chaperone SurA [Gammaproteobacteria bacterium]|nr:molecular chaperone SurA [Gammaproteobacteria bacterium]